VDEYEPAPEDPTRTKPTIAEKPECIVDPFVPEYKWKNAKPIDQSMVKKLKAFKQEVGYKQASKFAFVSLLNGAQVYQYQYNGRFDGFEGKPDCAGTFDKPTDKPNDKPDYVPPVEKPTEPTDSICIDCDPIAKPTCEEGYTEVPTGTFTFSAGGMIADITCELPEDDNDGGGTTTPDDDGDDTLDGDTDDDDGGGTGGTTPSGDTDTDTIPEEETYIPEVCSEEDCSDLGTEDTDGDGLSDLVELTLGTNPWDANSDKDKFDDGYELLVGTSPVATTEVEEVPLGSCYLSISNMNDGETWTDPQPLFLGAVQLPRGANPGNYTFEAIQERGNGQKRVTAATQLDENGVVATRTMQNLADDTYKTQGRVVDNAGNIICGTGEFNMNIDTSNPFEVEVSNVSDVPVMQTVIDQIVTLQDVEGNLVTRENPVYTGNDNQPSVQGISLPDGQMVVSTFSSTVQTGLSIIDSPQGKFRIKSSEPLTPGNHTAYIYSVRASDQAKSKVVEIPLEVGGFYKSKERLGLVSTLIILGSLAVIAVAEHTRRRHRRRPEEPMKA